MGERYEPGDTKPERGSGMLEMALAKFFVEEHINGRGRCPTYLYRWILFKCRYFAAYLHKFTGNDWSRDPSRPPVDRCFDWPVWRIH